MEIRWFYKDIIPENIRKWYKNINVQGYETRSDFYLSIAQSNIGIKVRASRLEIKWRTHQSICDLKNTIKGKIEFWTRIEWNDLLAWKEISSLFGSDYFSDIWIKVDKKRFQKKYKISGNYFRDTLVSDDTADCGMELTELRIKNQKWWTLGFDLFGKNKNLEYLRKLIEWQLNDYPGPQLCLANSYGYPEWICRILTEENQLKSCNL